MPARIVSEKVAVAVFPTESVTVMPKLLELCTSALPLSRPPEESVMPEGKVEPLFSVHVNPVPEPPVAASVCE